MDAINSLKPAGEIRMFAPLFYLKQKNEKNYQLVS